MGKPAITLVNGVVTQRVDYTLESFLLDFPAGVYTVCRTFKKHSIFDYRDHLNRLVDSISLKQHQTVSATARDTLNSVMRSVLPAGIAAAQQSFGESCAEFRITILVVDAAAAFEPTPHVKLALHVEALPDMAKPPVAVEMWDAPGRDSPNVKDSAWIRQRKVLKTRISGRVNEVILNNNGNILEGLSSNFYAVRNGVVYTAPDELILKGTVRTMVLGLCKQAGIPVTLQCPKELEAATWEGAFITSTSRLVLPVDYIEFFATDGTSKQVVRPDANHAIVNQIANLMRDAVEGASVRVVNDNV